VPIVIRPSAIGGQSSAASAEVQGKPGLVIVAFRRVADMVPVRGLVATDGTPSVEGTYRLVG
jgi:hypothetical protein